MGHYHHMHVTFVFEGLPKDIVEMLDLQDKNHYIDKYYQQVDKDIRKRLEEFHQLRDQFAEKVKGEVKKFIDKWDMRWSGFMLYESESFEWVEQGTDYPSGWECSGVHALHAKFDANYDNMGAFKDFIELVRPYIKSGAAWGWWESDMSSFEVFY